MENPRNCDACKERYCNSEEENFIRLYNGKELKINSSVCVQCWNKIWEILENGE